MNQGGTADKSFYSSLTENTFLSRTFLLLRNYFDRRLKPKCKRNQTTFYILEVQQMKFLPTLVEIKRIAS